MAVAESGTSSKAQRCWEVPPASVIPSQDDLHQDTLCWSSVHVCGSFLVGMEHLVSHWHIRNNAFQCIFNALRSIMSRLGTLKCKKQLGVFWGVAPHNLQQWTLFFYVTSSVFKQLQLFQLLLFH